MDLTRGTVYLGTFYGLWADLGRGAGAVYLRSDYENPKSVYGAALWALVRSCERAKADARDRLLGDWLFPQTALGND